MNYKIEEKRFLESAIISNVNGYISGDWMSNPDNGEQIVTQSVNLALEMLKQRNELFGSESKIKSIKEQRKVDITEIINIFNSVCVDLAKATKCTLDREKSIYKILETYTLEDIGTVFKLVVESDYLCGKKVEWKADFDWIFIPKNFIKILEGKYKNIDNGNKEKSNSELFTSAVTSETGKNFRFS